MGKTGSYETTCCQHSLIPWFYRCLGNCTTDYIEMRNCFNEGTNEDCPLEEYEIRWKILSIISSIVLII